MNRLSDHFTVDEFTQSQTAARLGINNDLPIELYETAKRTVQGLEEVRLLLRLNPIFISSGYRCPDLNTAVGSKPTSQHVKAEAVDFTCPTFGTPAQIVAAITKSAIRYDQVIIEFGRWVHISFTDKPRKQALVIDKDGTREFTNA